MSKPWEKLIRELLEARYLAGATPWEQSGFFGSEERWTALRRPILEGIDRSGSFLDIGCANGYLLECLQAWGAEKGVTLEPFGLDILSSFVSLAKKRLPQATFFVGNAMVWEPPRQFDYVRTELIYAPPERQEEYIAGLYYDFLAPEGTLLVCDYRRRDTPADIPWADEILRDWGFPVARHYSGFDPDGAELTRVVWVPRKAPTGVPAG